MVFGGVVMVVFFVGIFGGGHDYEAARKIADQKERKQLSAGTFGWGCLRKKPTAPRAILRAFTRLNPSTEPENNGTTAAWFTSTSTTEF